MAHGNNLAVTDEMWDKVPMENKILVEQYLDSLTTLADSTYTRYRIDLRQFFYWVYSSLNGKPLYKITSTDFDRYLDVLATNNHSASTIYTKRQALTKFFDFIEEVIKPNDNRFNEFVNNFREVDYKRTLSSTKKQPITFKEFKYLLEVLTQQKHYSGIAWVTFAYYTGAPGSDYIWLKREIVEKPFPPKASYVLSNTVRRETSGKKTKSVTYSINKEVYDALKMYVESQNYESEYIFTSMREGKVEQLSEHWAVQFCNTKVSSIIGRSVSVKDFVEGHAIYKEQRGKFRRDWNNQIIDGLYRMERDGSTIDLREYSTELTEILNLK